MKKLRTVFENKKIMCKNAMAICKNKLTEAHEDEDGALTAIEVVLLLLIVISVVFIIGQWVSKKTNSVLDKANQIDF